MSTNNMPPPQRQEMQRLDPMADLPMIVGRVSSSDPLPLCLPVFRSIPHCRLSRSLMPLRLPFLFLLLSVLMISSQTHMDGLAPFAPYSCFTSFSLPFFQTLLTFFPLPTTYDTKGAVRLAKKHYITSSLWVAGLITLTFFRGLTVPEDNLRQYNQVIKGIDLNKLYTLQNEAWVAEEQFRESKGWFSCDHACQVSLTSGRGCRMGCNSGFG